MLIPYYNPQIKNNYGTLTFDCGTRISCQVSIQETIQQVNNSWMNQYASYHGQREINIEIISPSNLTSDVFWKQELSNVMYGGSVSYKKNPVFYKDGNLINFYGFWIKSVSLDMNGDLTIDATCDYYDHNMSETMTQEQVRRLRKKKLERILNE